LLRYVAYQRIDALFIVPRFHFKYWGFGWLEPLPGPALHALFALLLLACLCVILGFYFVVACGVLAVGFAYLQLIDVATYLNHYYLLGLLLGLLAVSPAGGCASLDVRRRGGLPARPKIAAGWLYLFRFQIGVVYVFAGLAKLQGDWLVHAQPLRTWLASRSELPILGVLCEQPWAAQAMSWAGFLFDSTIPVWLSLRALRPWAYALVLVFHALTYLLFPSIGMFPAIMSVAALVFFAPDWPRVLLRRLRVLGSRSRLPAKGRPADAALGVARTVGSSRRRMGAFGLWAGALYCALQLLVPLRSLAYGGNVLWHEQGMRFSWRVMVRKKGSSTTFNVRTLRTGQRWQVAPSAYLTPLQEREMGEQPDLILQFAHFLRDEFARRGLGPVEVRADALVSLNGRAMRRIVDPTIDLAAREDGWVKADWILPEPSEEPPHNRAPSDSNDARVGRVRLAAEKVD
jgi:vitamin K-dependent gamma-carboxylase